MIPLAGIKIGAYIAGVLAIIGILASGIHFYNKMVRSEEQVSAQAAQIEQMREDQQHLAIGMKFAVDSAAARSSRFNPIRSAVNVAQDSHVCASAPPIAAFLDGMRANSPNDAGTAPPSAAVPAAVPAIPGSAKP
jgi:hypothetical protein